MFQSDAVTSNNKISVAIMVIIIVSLSTLFSYQCISHIYYWYLEKYKGTYCYEEDKRVWTYINRDDVLNSLVAMEIMDAPYFIRSPSGNVIKRIPNWYRNFQLQPAPSLRMAKIMREGHRDDFAIHRLKSLRDPWAYMAGPYDRSGWSDRARTGCQILKFIRDARHEN